MQYMTRCPFSLSRLVKVTETGQVVYKAEKDACRAFPDPQGDGLQSGAKRNFQVLSPLDFLAEFTQHIPPKGSHLIRYYGWYSNKARGLRRTAAEAAVQAAAEALTSNLPSPSGRGRAPCTHGRGEGITCRASQTWAMLIKRVYEIDPLECPKCRGQMKVIAFIEPPQGEVIEKILRHCGLWDPASPPRPPPGGNVVVYVPDNDRDGETAFFDGPEELTFVPDPDWDRSTPSSDQVWEVTCDAYGDTFDASF
jgi:hypothetical protein